MNSQSSGKVVPSDPWDWRKYGQNDILNSHYPREYYRCSLKISNDCPGRKQVERRSTDPNMIVISYYCEHNHPWPTQRNALTGSSSSFSNPSSKSSAVTTSASSSVSQNPTSLPSYLPTVVKKDDVEEPQDNMEFDPFRLGLLPEVQHPDDFWDYVEGDSPTMLLSHNSSGGDMENKATSSDVFSDVINDDS